MNRRQKQNKEIVMRSLTAMGLFTLFVFASAHASNVKADIVETKTGYDINVNTGLVEPIDTHAVTKERAAELTELLAKIKKDQRDRVNAGAILNPAYKDDKKSKATE